MTAHCERLNILWTNADPITAELMVFMYARNAMQKKCWQQVRIIIWGATAQLVAEDAHIQHLIAEAKEQGVDFSACIACAEQLGVKAQLEALAIEVKSWGMPLTALIKHEEKLLTM